MIILAKKTSSEILDMLISLFIIFLVCSVASGGLLESSFALPFAVLGMAAALFSNEYNLRVDAQVTLKETA